MEYRQIENKTDREIDIYLGITHVRLVPGINFIKPSVSVLLEKTQVFKKHLQLDRVAFTSIDEDDTFIDKDAKLSVIEDKDDLDEAGAKLVVISDGSKITPLSKASEYKKFSTIDFKQVQGMTKTLAAKILKAQPDIGFKSLEDLNDAVSLTENEIDLATELFKNK